MFEPGRQDKASAIQSCFQERQPHYRTAHFLFLLSFKTRHKQALAAAASITLLIKTNTEPRVVAAGVNVQP
ncbi:MAG TPA: hypothetical protein DCK99_09845, partial [Blastocatellia bacterium]|nr:hypothetical protein [Blastocatellia bacterium]